MILKNDRFDVTITRDETFSLQSTDNRRYEHIFNPANYKRKDYIVAFHILIKSAEEEISVALVGSSFCNDSSCAVLHNSILTVLMNDAVTRIDLQSTAVIDHRCIGDGTFFAIYEVGTSYIIHGELEIVKIDANLDRVWDFWGADIFVTQDGTPAFQMVGDRIFLKDWNGLCYELSMDGNLIENKNPPRPF